MNQEKSTVANDAVGLRKAQFLQVLGGAVMAIGTVIGVCGPALSGATILAGIVLVAGSWIAGPIAHRTAARGTARGRAASSQQEASGSAPVVMDVVWGDAA